MFERYGVLELLSLVLFLMTMSIWAMILAPH